MGIKLTMSLRFVLLLTTLFLASCTASTFVDTRYSQSFSAPDGIVPYKIIKSAQPQLPEKTDTLGVEGYVVLRLDISKSGKPENIVVVESEPEEFFDQSIINSAKEWVYRPATLNGNPVKVTNVTTFLSICNGGSTYYQHRICSDTGYRNSVRQKYAKEQLGYLP